MKKNTIAAVEDEEYWNRIYEIHKSRLRDNILDMKIHIGINGDLGKSSMHGVKLEDCSREDLYVMLHYYVNLYLEKCVEQLMQKKGINNLVYIPKTFIGRLLFILKGA